MIVMWLAACTEASLDTDTATPSLDPEAAEFVDAHNAVRAPLGIPDLSWSDTVAVSALGWAEALAADNCAFAHESQQTYGENLWWSTFIPTPTEVVDAWASEVAYYDYDSNSCQPGQMCGHYTQIVWANTELVGCGMATCDSGAVIWACRYDPPGNWVGEHPY